MWSVYFLYFVHDTRFSFPFCVKIRTLVRKIFCSLIHHFLGYFSAIFTIIWCRFRWVRASFYRPRNLVVKTIGASFLSDSIILIFLVQKRDAKLDSRTDMIDESDPTFTSPKKIEIVILKKISLKLSSSILSLLLLMPFSFMFNLWRT